MSNCPTEHVEFHDSYILDIVIIRYLEVIQKRNYTHWSAYRRICSGSNAQLGALWGDMSSISPTSVDLEPSFNQWFHWLRSVDDSNKRFSVEQFAIDYWSWIHRCINCRHRCPRQGDASYCRYLIITTTYDSTLYLLTHSPPLLRSSAQPLWSRSRHWHPWEIWRSTSCSL